VSSLDEPIRPGGYIKFIELKKFLGKDLACDIGDEHASELVPKVEYPPSSTLKDIFDFRDAPNNKKIVFMRSTKQETEAPTINSLNKDKYLIDNTVDIKKLLKTSSSTQDTKGEKRLVEMNGVQPYYSVRGPTDKTLVFESRFESGNLFSAIKVNDNDYNLLL